jgi:Terminase-like family.
MGIAEDCAWLRGERPWYPQSDPARSAGIPKHPVKGLIIANDWDKVQEIFTGQDGKLWKFLPSSLIKNTHRNHSGAVDTVHLHNRSALRFDTVKSFMSNPGGAESSDWDFIHVDEPCPEPMFKAQARGLVDRSGYAWFTLTALREPWITDAFDVDGVFARDSFVMEGTIYDNPYLSPIAIADYEATLTPDERECRLFGKPLHKAGLVYKEFQPDRHVLVEPPRGWLSPTTGEPSWLEPPLDWSYYLYIDPHAHVPTQVTFLVVDPFDRKYYWHDMFEKCLIPELCARVRAILGKRRLVRCRIDPIAYVEDPVDGTTWASEYQRCGLHVEKSSKDLSRGILRVQEDLRAALHPYFSPQCRRTLWEIKRYHWDEETGKPVDKDDHAMECLYRSVLDEPRYVDPKNLSVSVDDETIISPDFGLDYKPTADEVYVSPEHLMLA